MTDAKVGRPPKFKTADAMEPLIDAYFSACDEDGKPYTIAGLTRALGFESRNTLFEYGKKGEFKDTIKRAKLRVEEYLEQSLYGGQVAGLIFNLKNNFGWKDKQEVEHAGEVKGVVLWGGKP